MMCYVSQKRVGALCGLVGEFDVPLAAFVGGIGLMLLGSVEFHILRGVEGSDEKGLYRMISMRRYRIW